MAKLIAEIGSCHMGNINYCKDAIDLCHEVGAYALKFQLFTSDEYTKTGNIKLPHSFWPELWEYSHGKVPITASVFDDESLKLLLQYDIPFIKFAYSQGAAEERIKLSIQEGKHVICSADVMNVHRLPFGVTTLYCIPEYPVRYQIDFEGLFPRFDGFSDHTLGLRQTEKAIMSGARIIEKHFKLSHKDIDCPDSRFAINPAQLEHLAQMCRSAS